MVSSFRAVAIVCGALIVGCGSASAASLIYGTGLADDGSLLAPGSVDPHWNLIVGGTTAYVATGASAADASLKPVPPGWPLNGRYVTSTVAQWIAPMPDLTDITGSGNYEYVTTFDLSGFDPSTAILTGRYSVDNSSSGVFINGNLVPNTANTDIYSYQNFINFQITSGFKPGINTLGFMVTNSPAFTMPGDPNPSGLIVELQGDPLTFQPVLAPEPGLLWLAGSGLGALVIRRRWMALRHLASGK